MHQQLLEDRDNYRRILSEASAVALNYLENMAEVAPGKFVPDIAPMTLPESGLGASGAIEYFSKHFAKDIAATSGPRYFGFVTGGSTPAAVAADWLVSAYDQNACGSNDSIAPQIERIALHFLRELLGLSPDYFGTFVTGATMSNFSSLAQARQWIADQQGVDLAENGFPQGSIKILSGTPHSSIIKSMSMLGIGRKSLVPIPTLQDREAVDLAELENVLKKLNQPVIVVANAGTVNTVDFDNLLAIGNLKRKYKFWLHVDAAFGGFAAVSETYAHLIAGINAADSITIDAHKWLNVPYDAAMQFTRHKNIQLKVFQNSAAYLGDPDKSPDLFHYTPENSRRWRGFPVWLTLLAYGKQGHQEIVQRNCLLAQKLGAELESSTAYRLLAPVRMNVVCFTLKNENVTMDQIKKLLQLIRDDGKVFFTPTLYKGIPAIRAAISNWQTTDIDIGIAFTVLDQKAEELRKMSLEVAF